MKLSRFAFAVVTCFAIGSTINDLNAFVLPQLKETSFYVSPTGNDNAAGTKDAPFRTIARAQAAVRPLLEEMNSDVVVHVATGDYRLERPLKFTATDSGRNGFRVIYRSEAGPGKARFLASKILKGWQPYRDGIWKIDLPPKTVFHTLYENGQRAHKARFPNYEHHADFPTARGRYLISHDGTPVVSTKNPLPKTEKTNWLTYSPEVVLPVTKASPQMNMLIYGGGKCDWVRSMAGVFSIDPTEKRITITRQWRGIGDRARFFLEDDLGFLDASGEFFLDEQTSVLYYKPLGDGPPDALSITCSTLNRAFQFEGTSREQCVENIVLDGLAVEETDCMPEGPAWATSGLQDGAMIWLHNAQEIEIRNCHLKNSGRHGIMLIGHNVKNTVSGCWIEHTGINGVSLCNKFSSPDKKGPTLDRCEYNRIHNCHIHNVGEIHIYAECVTAFNVSYNEVSHCELHDSVRYAITVRGNTGAQYGPPVTTNHPPCKGNHFHHIRAYRCGQDGGDMGTLHCANLNNPDGEAVNTFDQITVADSAAHPSMMDIPPNGIFLDWPKMAMDQVFHNIHIVRSQGSAVRSNRPENLASTQTQNVSWKPGFQTKLMDYENIGLTDQFPAEYGNRRAFTTPSTAPQSLSAKATEYHTVELKWQPPVHTFGQAPIYTVYRNGETIAVAQESAFTDTGLTEGTSYRYQVAAQDGDFAHPGPKTADCEIRTPLDLTPPVVENVWSMHDGQHVRVLFSKPVTPRSALQTGNYTFEPKLTVNGVRIVSPDCVELEVAAFKAGCKLTVSGVTDNTQSRNVMASRTELEVVADNRGAFYPMNVTQEGYLLDCIGSAGDARLHGKATVEQNAGPFGGPALVLDGETGYAQASPKFDLGSGDFTLMLWMMRTGGGHTVLSKGNGFTQSQWAFGWPQSGGVSLRLNNVFHTTAAGSVSDGKWTHVAFVRRGEQGFTYVNGKPSGGPHDLSAVRDLTNNEPLRIGRRAHEPNPDYFGGKLAQVKMLNHALSAEKIQAEATVRAR